MLDRLKSLNAQLVAENESPLDIGIAINTGAAIVGSIGSAQRMEFTAIGNIVNVASRLEGLNKGLGTRLLLSKSTRDALQRADELRALPPQQIRGVKEPVDVFTII
jgi:adenylate cyclase